MDRNDQILTIALVAFLTFVFLLAFAPITVPPTSLASSIWSVTSSTPFIALISTFVAAYAGTWGAQKIAERTAKRKELLSEIGGTNIAIVLATNVVNTYLVLKQQHITELTTCYKKDREALDEYKSAIESGKIPKNTPFHYSPHIQTLSVPFCPIDDLRDTLRKKVNPDAKTLKLLTPLVQSIQGFSNVIEKRDAWISEYKATKNDDEKSALYFGYSVQGKVDQRYNNFMSALENQSDGAIAFGILIIRALQSHGTKLADQLGDDVPKILNVEFLEYKDLLPDMNNYSSWTTD